MSLIARMLSRMILIRFGVILAGLSAFVLTLEIVGYLTDIQRIAPNSLAAIAIYCAARLPATLVLFLPTSLLLALLLAMTELSYRNELTAIWATGVSPTRLIIKLLPMAILIGLLQFLVMDQGVPAAAVNLHAWGIGDYATRKFTTAENEAVWIRSGQDLMRAETISSNGATLSNLILFRRAPGGQLQSQTFADSATQQNGQWTLQNTTTYFADGRPAERAATMSYDGPMRLASNKVPGPEEMTLTQLYAFSTNDGFGVRPAYVYQMWVMRRLSPFFVSTVMLALCIPLGTYFRRGGGLGNIFVAGVLLGFAYFVGDGVASTLGETGAVAPWLAAFGPILIFAAIAMGLLARTDHV